MCKILVIDMSAHPRECYVCGESTSSKYGIPMYEDVVLPNDWTGEWFGQAACKRCFEAQSQLAKPLSQDQFLSFVREKNVLHQVPE